MLLQLRGASYYLRVRIPSDLQDIIRRAEIKRTLHTTRRREAKKFCRIQAAELERIFITLRLSRQAMNERQLQRFADKLLFDFIGKVEKNRQVNRDLYSIPLNDFPTGYLHNGDGLCVLDATLSRQREIKDLDQAATYHQREISLLREELKLGRYSEPTRDTARRCVKKDGLSVALPPESWFIPSWMTSAELPVGMTNTWDEPPPADFAALCRIVALTLLEGHEIELERVQGIYGTQRQIRAEERLVSASRCFTLNDLWSSYYGHKTTGEEWAATTPEKYIGFVAAINKTVRPDHDFSVYQDDVDRVTELIQQLKAYTSSRTGKRWSTSSVNDCIVFLSTLHRYAIRNRKFGVTFNPFEGRQVAAIDTKIREAFTADELAAIWQGLQTLKRKGKIDRYWSLLIMLYTGCRIGEVSQLRLDDFEKIGEHWVVHFRSRPEFGQSIKGEKQKKKKRPNETVDRVTAIHPHLRELGLFKYIDRLKENGEKQLFPGEKRTAGRSGVLMAKKIKTFMQQCLGRETDKSAHHCRHTLITWFKQNVNLSHTEASLVSAMVGHEDETINGGNKITWGTYGGPHTVKQMSTLIKGLDYGFPR